MFSIAFYIYNTGYSFVVLDEFATYHYICMFIFIMNHHISPFNWQCYNCYVLLAVRINFMKILPYTNDDNVLL